MNARNLGMSKIKHLIPNSLGNTPAGFFAETQGSGDFTNEFPFRCTEGWWVLTGKMVPIH